MINHLRKAVIFSILIVMNVEPVCAQKEIDSLKKVLPTLNGEIRVDALNSLASYLSYIEPQQADSLLELTQVLINELSYESGQVKKWIVEATLSNFRSKLDQSDSLLRLAIRSAENSNDSTDLVSSYMTFGALNVRRGNFAEAVEYHIKSLKIARAISNFELECANLMNIGVINLRLGDLEEARDFLLQAAEVANEHNLKYRLAQSYLNLGLIMFNLGEPNESIINIQKALDVFTGMNDQRGIAKAAGNLAFAHNSQGDYDKALEFYQQALSIYQMLQDPIEILKKQLEISRVYVSKGQLEQALNKVGEVLEQGQELDDLSIAQEAYKLQLDIYEKTNKHELALQTFRKLSITEDSIDIRANRARVDALEAEFELQLKNDQIELLEKESELSQTRQYLLALTVLLLVLSVFILCYIYITRLKRSRLNEHLALEKGEKEIRKNTTLTGELKQKSLELQEYAILLADHQEELSTLKGALQRSDKEADITSLNEASRSLNRKDVELLNWQDFRLKFDEVHSGFVGRLNTAHSSLTPREIDLCILLKVSVPNTEMSQILEISYDGVKKAIRRTYKKMTLTSAEELRNYILQLN